jgi:hypothetical protein
MNCYPHKRPHGKTHRLAALAVSITDPPPTLRSIKYSAMREARAVYVRKEVRKVVLPSPRDGVLPTVFGGFGDDAVVDLEGQVRLRLETLDRLVKPRKWRSMGVRARTLTVFMGRKRATLGSVNTPT